MYKKQIPLMLAFLAGTIPIVSFFITKPSWLPDVTSIPLWVATVIAAKETMELGWARTVVTVALGYVAQVVCAIAGSVLWGIVLALLLGVRS